MVLSNRSLNDIWHVYILRKHKHEYVRIKDGRAEMQIYGNGSQVITYQRHQCLTCKKIVGLDDWQINDLPTEMLYEKLTKLMME
jgi:hypothetical protein